MSSTLGVAGPEATEAAKPAGEPAPLVPDGIEHQAPEVAEDLVRSILSAVGAGIASSPLADPDVPDHFRFTEQELDDLTPPLTRIVNRRPALREALENGDELAVIAHLGGWSARNHLARALVAAWAQRREDPYAELDREADGDPGAAAGTAHAMDAGWSPGGGQNGHAGGQGVDR